MKTIDLVRLVAVTTLRPLTETDRFAYADAPEDALIGSIEEMKADVLVTDAVIEVHYCDDKGELRCTALRLEELA